VGWKYYLLFIILTTINIPLVWYFFPETKGLSLEEIGLQFGDEVAAHLTDLSDEQRQELDKAIVEGEMVPSAVHVEGRGHVKGSAV